MTISFQTQGGHTYGTLCTVTRVGQKVVKTYGESLGRVVDKDLNFPKKLHSDAMELVESS